MQISKYSYTYYVDGNQKSKTESVDGSNKGTTNYTYDGLNRLIKEQAPDKTYSYQYDSYGNRSRLSVIGDESYTTSYSYDKNNRLRKETKTAGNASEITDYWYDPNGNQISSMTVTTGTEEDAGVGIEPAGGNTNSIKEYDSWNQLTKTMQNGKTASYTYNGDGLRMSKTVDGTTTSHIWDGTNIAGDVTNGTVTKYIRGIQLISSKTGSNESFYTYNAHGDVVQLTNGSGNITKQYSYDAFGVEQNKDANDTNPFRYCGEYFDDETESVYLRARYYSPVSGRFITEDPIRDGLNWYSYTDNNPVMNIDPCGLADVPKGGTEPLIYTIGLIMRIIGHKADYNNGDHISAPYLASEKRELLQDNLDIIESYSHELAVLVNDVIISGAGDLQEVSSVLAVFVELQDGITEGGYIEGQEVIPEEKIRDKYSYYVSTGNVYLAGINAYDVLNKILPLSNYDDIVPYQQVFTGMSNWGYWIKVILFDKYRKGNNDAYNLETEDWWEDVEIKM